MSTATDAAAILEGAARTLRERDADYQGADALYARTINVLFPEGVVLASERDHHRFHLMMLLVVKLTRYVNNWEEGHPDSLIDLAAYAGMLQAVDQRKP